MLRITYIKNDEEKSYDLVFTRRAVLKIEDMGFNLTQVEDKILTSLSLLFYGALLKNYPKLTYAESESILDDVLENGYEINDLFPNLSVELQKVFTPSGEKKKIQVIE